MYEVCVIRLVNLIINKSLITYHDSQIENRKLVQ